MVLENHFATPDSVMLNIKNKQKSLKLSSVQNQFYLPVISGGGVCTQAYKIWMGGGVHL